MRSLIKFESELDMDFLCLALIVIRLSAPSPIVAIRVFFFLCFFIVILFLVLLNMGLLVLALFFLVRLLGLLLVATFLMAMVSLLMITLMFSGCWLLVPLN